MDENKEELKLPPKPRGAWENAFHEGAWNAALGGLVGGALSASSGSSKEGRLWTTVLNWAGTWAALGGLVGFYKGKGEVKAHALTVDNIKLEHELAEVKAEAKSGKSYVKQVDAKALPSQQCNAR